VTWEAEIRDNRGLAQWGKQLKRSHFQYNHSKKYTRGMAQAVEHMLSKCKALSSNPSPTKIKKVGKKTLK
jgi:hypothetical protein